MQRDAVVVVNGNLNLAEVGVAIATNNTQAVERWISEQLIMKPTAEELTLWNRENKQFTSIIVQPYVLIQDKPYAPEEDKPIEPLAESSIESSTEPSTEPSTEKE